MANGKGSAVRALQQPSTAGSAMTARLLDMIGGSWMSQAICVAAELCIPDLLAKGSQTTEELAVVTRCQHASLRRLLRGLASIGICVEGSDGSFAITPMGVLLCGDSPSSVRSWAIWWGRHLWPVWEHLDYSVRSGRSARELATGRDGYAHMDADPAAALVFSRAMVELTRLIAGDIVRAYDFSPAKRVVDVGGGDGALLMAILEAYPAIEGVLFDRPYAIEGAKKRVGDSGPLARCDWVEGNFFESVPRGGDIYLLKSVLHNWDDERAAIILGNCRRAMSRRARLLLIERIMPDRVTRSPRGRALARTDLNMLVGLGGRERTEAEFSVLLATSGLRPVALAPVGQEHSAIVAVPL